VYGKAQKLLNTYWSQQVFGSIQRVYTTNFTQILRVKLSAVTSVPISRENAYELHHVCRSVHLFVRISWASIPRIFVEFDIEDLYEKIQRNPKCA